MLKDLTIPAFRRGYPLEISSLAQVNVFTGDSNIGKTHLFRHIREFVFPGSHNNVNGRKWREGIKNIETILEVEKYAMKVEPSFLGFKRDSFGNFLEDNTNTPYMRIKGLGAISWETVGFSTLQIVRFIALAVNRRDGVPLFIDPIDDGISQKCYKALLEVIVEISAKKQMQVFMIANNIQFLKAFGDVLDKRDCPVSGQLITMGVDHRESRSGGLVVSIAEPHEINAVFECGVVDVLL